MKLIAKDPPCNPCKLGWTFRAYFRLEPADKCSLYVLDKDGSKVHVHCLIMKAVRDALDVSSFYDEPSGEFGADPYLYIVNDRIMVYQYRGIDTLAKQEPQM